jgi:hypothetical protein
MVEKASQLKAQDAEVRQQYDEVLRIIKERA